ncbi:MAG: hypothetical protein RR426_09735, partial [Oscillospiraceae bacterium]
MTWGEIRLRALQLMFSNEGAQLTAGDGNQEYLDACPGVANLALSILTGAGLPLRRKFTVTIDPACAAETVGVGTLTLPVLPGKVYRLELPGYCPDFRALDGQEIYLERDGETGHADDWRAENGTVFVIPAGRESIYTLYYLAYPTTITAQTPDTEEVNVPQAVAELVPLYIAAQLYREDDIQIATQLRNEFEDGLNRLQGEAARTCAGGGRVKNTTK